jgi:hypothetical protein
MERFMIHHSGEQYALFNRPDNEKISIHRECICSFITSDNFSSTEAENKNYKIAGEENDDVDTVLVGHVTLTHYRPLCSSAMGYRTALGSLSLSAYVSFFFLFPEVAAKR